MFDIQKNHPIIIQRVSQVNPEQLATTSITMAEQLKGWLNAINKNKSDKLIWAYQGLQPSNSQGKVRPTES